MKVIITEEQLKYIAGQELINEGIDEGLASRLIKGSGKLAKNLTKGVGKAMALSTNKNIKRAGLKLFKNSRLGMAKAGEIRKINGIRYISDGAGGWTVKSPIKALCKKVTDGNLIKALNTMRPAVTTADKVGRAAEVATAGAMVGGAVHLGKKAANKVRDIKNGYNSLRNSRVAENPDMPANTNTGTAQDVLQSMGFAGTGQSILQPKDPTSVWGRLYDKYGKDQ